MPAMSTKNMMISPAAYDLGIGQGDALAQQVKAHVDDIKKKKQNQQQMRQHSQAVMDLMHPTFGANNG